MTTERTTPTPRHAPSRRAFSALSAATLAATAAAGATALAPGVPALAQPAAPARPRALVLGLDGLLLDSALARPVPNLRRIIDRGVLARHLLYSSPGSGLPAYAGTWSGPGWATIFTGVWPDKHGVKINEEVPDGNYDAYPDLLTLAHRARPATVSFVAATWGPLAGAARPLFRPNGTTVLPAHQAAGDAVAKDAAGARLAAEFLRTKNPDLGVVVFDQIDAAGHAVGTADPGYGAAIDRVDAHLGELFAAIDLDEWTVVIMTDHGHMRPAGGHGGARLDERETWLTVAGPGIAPKTTDDRLRLVDIVPTVLDRLGLAVPGNLDGAPLGRPLVDDFDRVTLNAAGISHAAPSGWTIDNSRMPSGGDPNWRGWTFANQRAWSQAEARQYRENFMRGRGVLAIADSDEWDDVAHAAGPFDSTLIAPSRPVANGAAALRFEHLYLHEGGQTARVLVSFDGGAPREVRAFAANAWGEVALSVPAPAGARTAQFRFAYTGDNNWYWALDNVRFA